jgi:hypothetical protein
MILEFFPTPFSIEGNDENKIHLFWNWMANLITLVKLTGHHSISDLFRKMKEELKREREE